MFEYKTRKFKLTNRSKVKQCNTVVNFVSSASVKFTEVSDGSCKTDFLFEKMDGNNENCSEKQTNDNKIIPKSVDIFLFV